MAANMLCWTERTLEGSKTSVWWANLALKALKLIIFILSKCWKQSISSTSASFKSPKHHTALRCLNSLLDLPAPIVHFSAGNTQHEQSEHVQQHLRLVQRHEIRNRFCYSKYYYISILIAALAVRKIWFRAKKDLGS